MMSGNATLRWLLLLCAALCVALAACGTGDGALADTLDDEADADTDPADANQDTTDPDDEDTFDPSNPSAGEPQLMSGITAAHNEVRAATASMPRLFWSNDLAAFAQEWADELAARGCGLEHRPSSGEFAQQYGENLFWGSGNTWTPQQVVDAWASEVDFYDYERDTCEAGQMCGHYTAIVWKGTLQVGCARASCDGSVGQVWVCNYNPPGNVEGQRPY